uniref:Uncharacterized protein n=1 Tax=Solanum lycopersicum TaxID=4081 RepID=A0A3Q7GIN6_SOLLC
MNSYDQPRVEMPSTSWCLKVVHTFFFSNCEFSMSQARLLLQGLTYSKLEERRRSWASLIKKEILQSFRCFRLVRKDVCLESEIFEFEILNVKVTMKYKKKVVLHPSTKGVYRWSKDYLLFIS